MRMALLAVASITVAGTAHAKKDGIVIPPVELDWGVGVPLGDDHADGLSPSAELHAGLHWASLAWRPTRFDFGVGYVGSWRVIEDPLRADQAISMHGGYLALGTMLARGTHWRTWFTARGELLRAEDNQRVFSVLGGALRVTTELYNPVSYHGHDGLIAGTFAIGIYVEALVRDVPAAYGRQSLSSGVTLRLPFAVGS